MPLFHTEALTLRRRRLRDADAILTLLSRQYGKITASTRSVMKTASRLAGVTQSFHHLDVILYAKSESQDIWSLTQVSLIHRFATLQENLHKMCFASCLAEWVDLLSEEFESNTHVWNLILDAFHRWDIQEPTQEDLFYYQWRLLSDAGWQPQINHCVISGNKEETSWVFLPKEGGIASPNRTENGIMISAGTIQALRHIASTSNPPNIKLSASQKKEINTLLKTHLEYHSGGQSRAGLFLDKILNDDHRPW